MIKRYNILYADKNKNIKDIELKSTIGFSHIKYIHTIIVTHNHIHMLKIFAQAAVAKLDSIFHFLAAFIHNNVSGKDVIIASMTKEIIKYEIFNSQAINIRAFTDNSIAKYNINM